MLIFLKARNLKQLLQNTKYSIHIEIVATTILSQK